MKENNIEEIDSIEKFESEILRIDKSPGIDSIGKIRIHGTFFRGQTNNNWDLIPSLYREKSLITERDVTVHTPYR